MSWAKLRPDIKTLIDSIDSIEEVSALPKLSFSGYPAVTITPNEIFSRELTQNRILRTYSFYIEIFYNTKDGKGNAVTNIELIADEIVDKIDSEEKPEQTRTVGSSLSLFDKVLQVRPTECEWGYMFEQELVTCRIRLDIDIIHDLFKALLQENGAFLLQENGALIYLELGNG